jgi:hypothetical protein
MAADNLPLMGAVGGADGTPPSGPPIFSVPSIGDPIEAALLGAVVRKLRAAAGNQRKRAAEGTGNGGEKFPNVTIRSPEAALSVQLALDWDEIADILQAGAST